jgi:hypothetical protein
MLLKFLVVIWFFKVLINLFSRNAIFRTLLHDMGNKCKEHNINIGNKEDIEKYTDEQKSIYGVNMIIFVGMFIERSIVILIDVFMMLSMLKYDKTIITTLFLILTLIQLIIALIKSKKATKKKDDKLLQDVFFENEKNLGSYGFKITCLRLLNIVYWGYAVYLLFFI